MLATANFRVDTRLASLLGEAYRSTELALKELVDNAWDADAQNVYILLPEPLTKDPIIIRDDGIGMTEAELRSGFLKVASDRRIRRGSETSPRFERPVKGRKGIGKFAGLAVASIMEVETRSRGYRTTLTIRKDELSGKSVDLEKVPLPLLPGEAAPNDHGTIVTLTELSQSLSFPDPQKLKQILYLEYGRQANFQIYVNGEVLSVADLPGESTEGETQLPEVGLVKYRFVLAEKQPPSQAGVVIRAGSKVIGSPHFFGLDRTTDIPKRILKMVYGEVEADGLAEDVTVDWGDIIENSTAWQRVKSYVQPKLHRFLTERQNAEVQALRQQWQGHLRDQLAELPKEQQKRGEKAMTKLLEQYPDPKGDQIRMAIDAIATLLKMD